MYERALQILEEQLGADHPDTATSLNNLAASIQSQGKYKQAEPFTCVPSRSDESNWDPSIPIRPSASTIWLGFTEPGQV